MKITICGEECKGCQDNCTEWFGPTGNMSNWCKEACKQSAALTKEEFLCSGTYVPDLLVKKYYGDYPCPVITPEPPPEPEPPNFEPYSGPQKENDDQLWPVLLGVGVLVLIFLGILYATSK
jgi:hypothetical protein